MRSSPGFERRLLVLSHAFLSLSGVMFHLTLHPPRESLTFWWAAPMSVVSLFFLPLLFLRRRTVGAGVLMNGCAVCAGVVGMIFYGFQHPPESDLLSGSLRMTVAPVLLLLIKLPLAHLILLSWKRGTP